MFDLFNAIIFPFVEKHLKKFLIYSRENSTVIGENYSIQWSL